MLNRRTSMLPVSRQKVSKLASAKQRAITTQTEPVKNDFNLLFCQSKQNDSVKKDYMKALNFINSCHKSINDTIQKNNNGTNSFLLPKIADYSKLFDILTEQKSVTNAEIHKQKIVTEIGDVHDQKFELLEAKQEIIHEILEDAQFLDKISCRVYAKAVSEELSKKHESTDRIVLLPDLEQIAVPKELPNLQKSKYTSVENDSLLMEAKFSNRCLSSFSLDSNSSEIKTDSDLE